MGRTDLGCPSGGRQEVWLRSRPLVPVLVSHEPVRNKEVLFLQVGTHPPTELNTHPPRLTRYDNYYIVQRLGLFHVDGYYILIKRSGYNPDTYPLEKDITSGYDPRLQLCIQILPKKTERVVFPFF